VRRYCEVATSRPGKITLRDLETIRIEARPSDIFAFTSPRAISSSTKASRRADFELGPDLERLAPLVSQRDGLQPRLLIRSAALAASSRTMEIEVRILVGRDEEGVRVTGKGIRIVSPTRAIASATTAWRLRLLGVPATRPPVCFSCSHASTCYFPLLLDRRHRLQAPRTLQLDPSTTARARR